MIQQKQNFLLIPLLGTFLWLFYSNNIVHAQQAKTVSKQPAAVEPTSEQVAAENSLIAYTGSYFLLKERKHIGTFQNTSIQYLDITDVHEVNTGLPPYTMGDKFPINKPFRIRFEGLVFSKNNKFVFINYQQLNKLLDLIDLIYTKKFYLTNADLKWFRKAAHIFAQHDAK